MSVISLKRNIIANYASQLYVALIGIVILPVYLSKMGAEAYGLIGFFTMLQAWFLILDVGLSQTIARETARFRAKVLNALDYLKLFRALSIIFIITALLGASLLLSLSSAIAQSWLNLSELSVADVAMAIQIMVVIVALRWLCGLYRGVVSGSERLVWLSGYAIAVATLRFVVVLPVMFFCGFTPKVFFLYQLAIACIEFGILLTKAHALLPAKSSIGQPIGWSFKPIKPVLNFALSIALTSSIWVVVTQMDKFIVSGVLGLDEYGYFSLAVLAASIILIISGPVSNAILPRMANLFASNEKEQLVSLYRKSTVLIAVLCGSAVISLSFAAYPVVYFWTGDAQLAKIIAPVLQLYAIGNGILTVAAFPYYLQYAEGNLRLHVIGNLILISLLVPSVIYFSIKFGAIGAGLVWLFTNLLYFLVWVPLVHAKLMPGLHKAWLFNDVIKTLLPATIVASILYPMLLEYQFSFSRIISGFFSIVVSFIVLIVVLLSVKDYRQSATKKLIGRFCD